MENERLLSELFAQYDIGKETRTDFLKRLNAARDRWWLSKVNPFIGLLISCIMSGEKLPDAYEQWQSLKQSILEAKQ